MNTIPHPHFAYQFACDYANDGNSIITISKICRWKVAGVIHPGNYSLWPTNDSEIIKKLSTETLAQRKKKEVFAMQDPDILKKLIWIEELDYSDEEVWYQYSTLWRNYPTIDYEIELFREFGIELILDKDEELLKLLRSK